MCYSRKYWKASHHDWFETMFVICFKCVIKFVLQKKTKYTTDEAKYKFVNETIDRSKYTSEDLKNMIINGTYNMTTKKKMVSEGSNTVPDGMQVDPKGSINVLGLVVFSIVFGIVLGRIGERGMPLKAFFEALNEVIMKMVALVMW